MKRTLILTMGLLLAAGFASAQITGTDHDLKGETWNAAGEICLPCHTPHNAYPTGSSTIVPLWNHADSTTATFTLYTSPTDTLDATLSQPAGVSKACLSCHDGSMALDSFGGSTAGTDFMTGAALVGTDLSNDHPVSFTYDAALVTADGGGLNDPTSGPVSALLFGGQVECGSCHDVHNAGFSNFLVMSNTASALCLTCHAK